MCFVLGILRYLEEPPGYMQLVNVLKKAMAEITLLTFCLPKFLLEFVPI